MSRAVGEFELLQEVIPDSLAVVVALLTQFGDIWFVTLVFIIAFVRFDRDRIATAGGVTLGAIALLLALKYTFALPRPDRPLVALETLPPLVRPVYELTAYASGYGFPSGHAVVTTVAYLSLAEVLPVSTRRRRFSAAVSIIAVVGFSRIALGLHYLVDVLAGILIGVAFLSVTYRLLSRYRSASDRRTVALGISVVLAFVSVIASSVHPDTVLLFVVSGVLFGLSRLHDRPWSADADGDGDADADV